MSDSAAMNINVVLLNQSKHLFLHCHASALTNYLSVRKRKKHCHMNKEESTEGTRACHCWRCRTNRLSGGRSTDLQKGATLQINHLSLFLHESIFFLYL
jgi:hypothetical protein